MATLTETLGANPAPPTEGVDISGNLIKGVQAGVQLATAQEQVQQKKQEVEAQKAELVMKQASTANSLLTNLARANPMIAKKMLPQIREKLINLGVDPTIADYTISDDANRQRQVVFSQMAGGKLTQNKDLAKNYFQSLADVVGYEQAGQAFDNELKRQQQDRALATSEHNANVRANAMLTGQKIKMGTQQERIHNQNLAAIQKDPNLNKQLVQIQNLKNSISNIESGAAPTPQAFEELQQSVRSNLGIKGQTGVNERASSYMKGLGMDAAEIAQFFSMKPQDINDYGGTAFLEHIKALANNEIQNVSKQASQKIDTLAAGHKSFYSDKPDLGKDYETTIAGQKALFAAPQTAIPVNKDAQALQTINPATGKNYTQEEIDAYKKAKGIK